MEAKTNTAPRALTALLVSSTLLGLAGGARADTGTVRWYDFQFRGQKVGFTKVWEEAVTVDGEPAVEVHQDSRTELARMDHEIVIDSTIVATARPDGTPLKFVHRRTEGAQVRRISGRRDGDEMVITQHVGARTSEERVKLERGMLLASTIVPLFYPDLKEGSARSGKVISENEGDVQPFSYRVVEVRGEGARKRFVVEESQGGIESRSVVRPDGVVERTDVPAMGAAFVLTKAEDALRLDAAVDIFDEALFSASAPIPDRGELKRLELLLSTESGDEPSVPTDRRQQVRSTKAGLRLTLTRLDPPASSARIPVRESSKAPYLGPTPFESLDDPQLVAASAKAVGDASHVWPATQRLARFVHDHIRSKTLSQAFTSASEALETREGDCTEHAVLFSALAKIAGIPTRLVTGLVYIGGPKHQFGYHEWVEVWTGEHWHPVDPTFGQTTADATHIQFTTGQSDPAGLRKAGIVAGSLIGNLDIEVLGYTLDGGETVQLK
jgi:transglutaminase-like putative cysteine protease